MPLTLDQLTRYRGIFSQVARELGVDPSLVSRVARGQRRSQVITEALEAAVKKADSKVRNQRSGA